MQQRQPRLGDILDDYCPRERRLTNHVVVAMVGDTVKQTRCSTCDSDHEYKHASLPRQRKKSEESSLYTQVLAGVTPKKMVPDPQPDPVIRRQAYTGGILDPKLVSHKVLFFASNFAFDKTTGDQQWKVSRNYKTPTENDHSYATPLLSRKGPGPPTRAGGPRWNRLEQWMSAGIAMLFTVRP